MFFVEEFCMNCLHEKFLHTNKFGDKQCDIFSRSLIYGVNEPGYPEEWIYDENDNPTCTAWRKWDWGNDDDDDDGGLNNPPELPPDNPNQLVLPFIFDELGIEKERKILQL
jgi:hypothetical protein